MKNSNFFKSRKIIKILKNDIFKNDKEIISNE